MSAVIGPIARSLIDPEILNDRLAKYRLSTSVAGRSKVNDSPDISKNGIVTDCLHQQMWNRITQQATMKSQMVEDRYTSSMMPAHPDNRLDEEGQAHSMSGCVSHSMSGDVLTLLETGLGLNEEGRINNEPDLGLNEEGARQSIFNTLSGCTVDAQEKINMIRLQEPNTDNQLNISDCLDGGINTVCQEVRMSAITPTLGRQLFEVASSPNDGCCHRVRLDVDRQKNTIEVWDKIKRGQRADAETNIVYDYLKKGKQIPASKMWLQAEARKCHVHKDILSVSYTHLTLPTKDSV